MNVSSVDVRETQTEDHCVAMAFCTQDFLEFSLTMQSSGGQTLARGQNVGTHVLRL